MDIEIKGPQPLRNVSAVSCKVDTLIDLEAAGQRSQALQFLTGSGQ
jgi:hypothetical protein